MEIVLVFAAGLLIYTLSLWLSAKLIGDEGKFLEFLIIAAIASLIGLVPYGGIISIVVFFVLLNRLMDIDLLKGILICGLASLLRFGAVMGISKLLSA